MAIATQIVIASINHQLNSFLQVNQIAQEFGSGLIGRGIEAGEGNMIGLFAQNRLQVIT